MLPATTITITLVKFETNLKAYTVSIRRSWQAHASQRSWKYWNSQLFIVRKARRCEFNVNYTFKTIIYAAY